MAQTPTAPPTDLPGAGPAANGMAAALGPDVANGGAADPGPNHAPPARRRTLRWWLAGGLAATAAGLLLVGSGATWLWATESGTRWALSQVPGLQFAELQGAPGLGNLSLGHLNLKTPAGELTLKRLQLQGLQVRWRPAPGQWLAWQLASAQVAELRWQSAPSTGPSVAPAHLRLPVALTVAQLNVASARIDALPELRGLQARLWLAENGGARHRVQDLRLQTDRFALRGEAQLAADAPLQTQLQAQLDGRWDDAAWQARLDLAGPLAELQAKAQLQGEAAAGRPAQHLSAQARLRPFAPWPLGELQLQAEALDLSALLAGAPRTRLRGQVQVRSAGLDQPAQADLALHNDAATAWGQGGLPVRSLQFRASGTPQPLQRLDLKDLQLVLGPAQAEAGRITGHGHWQADAAGVPTARIELALSQGRPAALDPRLPAMVLSGPVTLALRLPPQAADTSARFDARLTGQLAGAGPRPGAAAGAALPPVVLALAGQADRQGLALEQLLASAGSARLQASGRASRVGAQGWRWDIQADVADLDPSVWYPGEPGSPWRRGPHRLSGRLASSGQAPQAALADPLVRWRELAGQASLQLAPSQLAGVALQGEAGVKGAGEASQAQLRLQAGPNRLAWEGAARRGQASLDAPELAALAPLLALLPAARPWLPSAGSVQAELAQDGPPAAAQWQASLTARNLQTPSLRLGQLQLSGRSSWLDGAPALDAPLALSLQADDLAWSGGPERIEALRVTLGGSLRQHQLQASAVSPLRPPVWFDQLLGANTGSGTRLALQAEGRWQPAVGAPAAGRSVAGNLEAGPSAGGAGTWTLRLPSLLGQASDGSGQPWLAGRDLQLQAELGPAAVLRQLSLAPGRLQLPGTALQWQTARYQAANPASGGVPRLALEARIEPFAAAPLLARAQPELGWRGDLMLAGSVSLRSEQRFDADVVFERQSGDLSVADDVQDSNTRYQSLGLSDLRLGLAAHDGTWHFTQALAGRRLGEMAAALTVRTRADALWPPADAPLEGVAQVHVARLGAWGAWLPPGWRLGGELTTSASLGGRVGAPEVTGQLQGRGLSVRNALEGVDWTEGEVDLRLQGPTARVERFEFKGGEGRLAVTGEATLGQDPTLALQGRAERFQVLGRIDRRILTSGQASLRLARESLSLQGQLKVDEGLIDFSRGGAPGLDDDVSLVQSSRLPAAGTEAGAGSANGGARAAPRRAVSMKLLVNLGEQLRIKGRGLDTRLLGELSLGTTPAGRLSANGVVRTDRGTYAAYGQKLTIERGQLTFTGPVDDPRLDIFASRPNLDVTVGVAVTGSALIPRVRLYSEPEMADIDKLSWLVLGRASDGLGRTDTALLQRAALALLAGEGEAPTDALLNSIGLTDFSVRQDDSGDTRETVVTLGKQLSRRWYLGYERSVNAASGTWQLIYRAAQRFTLRAQSGEDNALDLIWTWRWD